MLRDESKVLAHLNPQVRLGHPAIMGMDCVVLGQLPGNESERERERERGKRRRGGEGEILNVHHFNMDHCLSLITDRQREISNERGLEPQTLRLRV